MTDTHDTTSTPTARALASGRDGLLSDDDIAATQQSILEELHTISEEALTANLDHTNDPVDNPLASQPLHAEVNAEAEQPNLAADQPDAPQVSTSQSMSQLGEDRPRSASLRDEVASTPSTLQRMEDAMLARVPAVKSPTTATTTEHRAEGGVIEAETTIEIRNSVDDESHGAPQTQIEAAAVAVDSLPLEPGLPIVTPLSASIPVATQALATNPEIQDAAPSQMDNSFELDHAELFDGIEADAFDDIELSPPVRRHVALPSLDAAIGGLESDVPASSIGTRLQTLSQTIEAATAVFDADDAADHEPLQLPPGSQTASFLHPCFLGFQTGHKKQIKLSDKALERARKLMMELDESTDLLPPPQASQSSLQMRSHATSILPHTAHHTSNPRPTLSRNDRSPMQEIVPRQSDSVANQVNGSEKSAAGAEGKVSASRAESVVPSVPAAPMLPARQVEALPLATPKPARNGLFTTSQSLASPMRTPAATSGSRFTTPQPSKRISLGMLPRGEIGGSSAGKKRSLPRFVTPFKDGKRPRLEDLQDPASPLRTPNGVANHNLSKASPLPLRQYPAVRKVHPNPQEGPTVFLMKSNGPRHKLAAVGRPEYYSSMQMIAKGVPDEVVVVLNDASRAAHYAFEGPEGSWLMQQQALEELRTRGCSNATIAWVQNHWTLILWKLAALVRLEPSSAPERWSWKEVIRQLLYRYEREAHLAQRSCIKRIQERDSSAARPMVLVVSMITEEENEVKNAAGEIVPRKSTILELSDGWYRILAQIDPVLTNACQRGRLRIGQKLAITGATLDAQGEGKEVLAAYHMSSLVLAANSVSLAPWDSKLGFAPTPFCSSLRSLTPEGGLVSLMDVVITKVYPLAYMDVDRSNPGAPRGEQEEAEVREAWQQRREHAIQQLELQMETENRRLYDLVEALNDLVGDTFLPSIPDDPSGRLEAFANKLFDELRDLPNPASAVRDRVVAAGHVSLVPWLHNLAKSAILEGEAVGGSRLGADLDKLCPPRKVREFRVVKFRDARLPSPPPPPSASTSTAIAHQGSASGAAPRKKNPYARSVQLTVWDATQLGDELREGRRFLVTNLVPMSKSAWRKADEEAEVFLSTRRDTKWRPVA